MKAKVLARHCFCYLNSMKRVLIIGFFLVYVTSVMAQRDFLEGYVVLNSGDTLRGVVKDRKEGFSSRLWDRIILKHGKKRMKFRPDQLLAYNRGGSEFHSVPFNQGNDLLGISRVRVGQKHFLKVYIRGYLSLYEDEFLDDSQSNFDGNFYLIREDELQYLQVSMLFFRKKMVPYFEDAPHIARAIEDREYKYRDIITIVTEYNKWRSLP